MLRLFKVKEIIHKIKPQMITLSRKDVLGKKTNPQTSPSLLSGMPITWGRGSVFLAFSPFVFLCSVIEMVSCFPFK